MSVRAIEPHESVGATRGEVVVCVAIDASHERFVQWLRTVLAHTPEEVRVLICDGTGADSCFARLLQETGPSTSRLIRLRTTAAVNDAFRVAAPADVVVLRAECGLAEGWLRALREAAYADAGIATAMALSTSDLPRSASGADDWTLEQAASAVSAGSLRIRPRVPAVGGPCSYVRRSALELVGDFDLDPSRSSGPVLDFSERCVQRGLYHVLADDVLVGDDRVPALAAAWAAEPRSPLARSLGVARRVLHGLSVTVDARILTGPMDGTKVHVLELIAALARTRRARITAILPTAISRDVRRGLEVLSDVELTTATPGDDGAATVRADIVHRPFQISAPADLAFLAPLGDRLLITHQDLISYHNPSYFSSVGAWEGYRELTRRALGAADRVLFFSEHVRADALTDDLVESARASVVHIGVNHTVTRTDSHDSSPPRGVERLPEDVEMMLCLGTDFRHKNRVFALRILDELRRRHEWSGWLVMAGPRVAFGSSIPDEEQLLAARPELGDALLNLDAVSEAEKTWLLRRASLVLYPTVHEGFGLVPFEAADHGVPCLWAPCTALSEVLPDAVAGILPWDAAVSADRALVLMRDPEAAERNVQSIRSAAATLSWDRTAERLIQLYHSVCNEPPAPSSAIERVQGLMQDGVSEDAMRLVGPDGVLPRDVERPLLALATRRNLSAPVFRAIRAGYRVSYRWRRSGSRHNGADV